MLGGGQPRGTLAQFSSGSRDPALTGGQRRSHLFGYKLKWSFSVIPLQRPVCGGIVEQLNTFENITFNIACMESMVTSGGKPPN